MPSCRYSWQLAGYIFHLVLLGLRFPIAFAIHCQGLSGSPFRHRCALVPSSPSSRFHDTEHLRLKTYFYSPTKLDSSVPFLATNVLNSADYKEPILPKVLMVLNGFTMLLHPVPLPPGPLGIWFAVQKALSQNNILLSPHLIIEPGGINCPVSKHHKGDCWSDCRYPDRIYSQHMRTLCSWDGHSQSLLHLLAAGGLRQGYVALRSTDNCGLT